MTTNENGPAGRAKPFSFVVLRSADLAEACQPDQLFFTGNGGIILVFAFFAAFRHAERNLRRSLPFSFFSSACFEHSSEAAERGFAGAFAAFTGLAFLTATAAGFDGCAAGSADWANALPADSRTAMEAADKMVLMVMEHVPETGSGPKIGPSALAIAVRGDQQLRVLLSN